MSDIVILTKQEVQRMHKHAKPDTLTKLIDYSIAEPGAVQLSADEQARWDRLLTANTLMLQSKRRKKAAAMLVDHFGYSIATANRDVEDAMYVFGDSIKLSKKYYLRMQVDRLEDAIALAQANGDLDMLAKFSGLMLKAIEAMPDDTQRRPPPTAIVYHFTELDGLTGGKEEYEEAIVIAEEKLGGKFNLKELLDGTE